MGETLILDRDGNTIPAGKEPKMRVRVNRPFGLGNGNVAQVGDVLDLPEAIVRGWVQTGRVSPVTAADEVEVAPAGMVEHGDVSPGHRDPIVESTE